MGLKFAIAIQCDWCPKTVHDSAYVQVGGNNYGGDAELEISEIPTWIPKHPFGYTVPENWTNDGRGLTCDDCLAREKREAEERLEERRKKRAARKTKKHA